jgi:hypothetical protein
MSQQFDIERANRTIETMNDPARLRQLAKDLFHAWQTQKAATIWEMHHPLNKPMIETGSSAAH